MFALVLVITITLLPSGDEPLRGTMTSDMTYATLDLCKEAANTRGPGVRDLMIAALNKAHPALALAVVVTATCSMVDGAA